MRHTWHSVVRIGLLTTVVALAACGKSGEQPPVLPEARFEIVPQNGGTAQFELVDVQVNGAQYTSLAGVTITTLGRFNVFIENGPAPFGITIRLIGTNPVEVRYGLAGIINDTVVRVVDTPGVDVFVGTPSATLAPALDVHMDVCAPFPGSTQCSPYDGQSVYGAPITGSIGDVTATRLLGRASNDEPEVGTPSIFFYYNAQDSIAGIIRANDNRYLLNRLWVNGSQADGAASTGDVVVKSDL